MLNRRKFIATQTTAMLGIGIAPASLFSSSSDRKFKMSLNAGSIGVSGNQLEVLDYAIKYGFEAMTCNTKDLLSMDARQTDELVDKMKAKSISWGSAGLPLDFRKDEATYQQGLKALPKAAKAMEEVGASRMNTWIMPTQADRTYRANFELHQKRIKEISNILGHHGIRFGLEYVGPKTLMSRDKYSFIRTMAELKELIEAVDEDNLGFILDSFHWFCAGESAADILSLENKDIVAVDLNDARAGISADDQIDGKRELPGASGEIDLKSFLQALTQLGYDGPVRAEPFNKVLWDMENDDALAATYKAMSESFSLI
ncbi:MAG: sugar phosphate isomerase/epimerase family protein [Bacteroidia bacterium]|nr:sugar phosphate isomerase/epimerase family protein [Bacteroidia bacterium]